MLIVSFSSGADALAVAAHLGLELLGLWIEQHDAAAVGLDPLEDQLHDAVEQLIDVERVADGQRRAIHDLQIAAGPGQPGAGRRLRVESRKSRCLPAGSSSGRSASRRATWLRETMSILSDRSSELASPGSVNSISVLPTCTWSPLVSSCCSTRLPLTNVPLELLRSATREDFARAANFGVPARDFGIVNLDRVRGVAAKARGAVFQFERGPLVATLDDK